MGRKPVKVESDASGCSSRRNSRPVVRCGSPTPRVPQPQAVRPMDRQLMRPWMINQINSKEINGLIWMDSDCTLVKIPWKHGSRHGWKLGKDACLFKRWAMHTGKFSEHDANPKRWKANFRCAINSLPDVQEERNLGQSKGHQAFKVYRLLEEKKRKKDIKTEVDDTPCKVERRKRSIMYESEEEEDEDDKDEDYYPTKKSRCEKLKNQKRKMISRKKIKLELPSPAVTKEEPEASNSIEEAVDRESSHSPTGHTESSHPHFDHDYYGGVSNTNTDSQLCTTPVAPHHGDNTDTGNRPCDAATPHTPTSPGSKAVLFPKIGSGGCVVLQTPYAPTDTATSGSNGSVVVQSTYPQNLPGFTHGSFTSLIESVDRSQEDDDDASVITDDNIADYIDNMESRETRPSSSDSGISSPPSNASSLDGFSPPWSPVQSPELPSTIDAACSTTTENWDTFNFLTNYGAVQSTMALSITSTSINSAIPMFKIPVPDLTVTIDSSDEHPIMTSDPAMPTPLASAPSTPDVFTELLPLCQNR